MTAAGTRNKNRVSFRYDIITLQFSTTAVVPWSRDGSPAVVSSPTCIVHTHQPIGACCLRLALSFCCLSPSRPSPSPDTTVKLQSSTSVHSNSFLTSFTYHARSPRGHRTPVCREQREDARGATIPTRTERRRDRRRRRTLIIGCCCCCRRSSTPRPTK